MDWQKLADKLDKKIYLMLLFTVAVIPLRQEFTAFCVSMTFLAALFVAVVQKKQAPQVLRPWQQGALWVLVAISIISIYFSRDRFISSWNWLYVVGQYCALFFVLLRYGWREQESCQAALREQGSLWQRFQSLPRPLQLVGAFLAVSVFVSALGILQKVLGIAGEGIWSDPDQFPDLKVRVYSTLVNPNILAGYLVLVIAYATAFFNVAKGKLKLRLIFLGIGILAALCLLYTYSRGNWLACTAVLLAFCIFFCHKAFVPVLAGGAAALAVGGAAVMQRLASITSGEDTSAALRIAYMESTVAVIEDFPWGVGWCGYRFVYPDYNFYLDDTSVIMYHCHNIFLNVFAELGVQGILAFLLVWWGIFLPAGWRLAYAGRTLWLRAMGRGYVLATVGIAIGGLTDHVYFNTQMGLVFWLLGGLTMLCAKINSDRNM